MIRFISGEAKTIKVPVSSSIDTTGFSLKIMFGGTPKVIEGILNGHTYQVPFEVSDVADIPDGEFWGAIQVLDASGNVYQTMQEQVKKIGEGVRGDVGTFDELPIVLAANWVGQVEGGGDTPAMKDYVKRSDFNSIDDPKNSVNSNTETIKQVLAAAKGA